MKILALDIGGTAIKSAIADESGEITELQENATNAKNGGPYVMERAMEIAACYSDFDAIGISTTGQVDPKTGSITYANENVPNYTGTPVKQLFEEKFHRPVFLESALPDLWNRSWRSDYHRPGDLRRQPGPRRGVRPHCHPS